MIASGLKNRVFDGDYVLSEGVFSTCLGVKVASLWAIDSGSAVI